MSTARIHVQFRRHAEPLERHEQLFGLRPRDTRIALDDVDHRRRLRILDVLERRLIPVRVEVVVRQLVSEIELADPLHIALGVHRDPVGRSRSGADRLEAIGVRENPVRPVTAGAPAEHAHLGAIDDSLGDQVVDARHDVFVALLEIVADDVGFVLFAVVGRAAVVWHQHSVAGAGVSLRAITAIEAEHIGSCRSAKNESDIAES